MSLDDTPPGRRGEAARELTIDLEELTWALNSREALGESSHRLNIKSGTILSLIGPDADGEADEDPRDDDRWLFIEPIESSEAFRVREDSIHQCGEDRLAPALPCIPLSICAADLSQGLGADVQAIALAAIFRDGGWGG